MMLLIIQSVKDYGLLVVLCGHPHMPLQDRRRISASEKVCELRFGVLSRKRQLSSSVLPKVIPLAKFWYVWLPTHLDKKAFTFCKLNLNPSTRVFLNGKLLVAK